MQFFYHKHKYIHRMRTCVFFKLCFEVFVHTPEKMYYNSSNGYEHIILICVCMYVANAWS